MSHLECVAAWVQSIEPMAEVLFGEKKLGKIQRTVDGSVRYPVEEIYLLRRVLPKAKESLAKMQELQNRLTLAGRGEIVAEKAQLARVLPGSAGVYQITLKAGYQMDLEDENGED